ncbi:hypothetical protein H5P36_02220 [Bacillus sp. APMAM]|nr:hypothetical protein [Bacillus sp. APMAM]RTZ57299.1 hypothetical protein EKO25_03565 [Bacillus sp. SAJ1]
MLSRVLKQQVPTSAGAIVMATGILLLGAMQKVVFQHKDLAIISTTLVLLLLFIVYIAFVRDMILGVMWERHFCDPISSFGVGTWIAATSVSILVIMNFALFLRPIALILFLLNCILTISYIAIIVRNYILLFKSNGSRLRKKVHGILLLASVAIQSIIAAGQSVFGKPFVAVFGTWLWWTGCLLYGLGFVLILNRYIRSEDRNLAQNWKNTNCIIHGAMSISGLVGATMDVVSPAILVMVWIWVMIAFCIVEGIEIARSMQRIKRYGWKEGMWIYDTSQWARNFTFGMLLAFSMHLPKQGILTHFVNTKSFVLSIGPYIVVILFVVEVLIALTGRTTASKIPESVNM